MMQTAEGYALLELQQLAVTECLQDAYRAYYRALSGQEPADPAAIDRTMIAPLEAEFQRIQQQLDRYQVPWADEEDED